jgi:hypothetical protein
MDAILCNGKCSSETVSGCAGASYQLIGGPLNNVNGENEYEGVEARTEGSLIDDGSD